MTSLTLLGVDTGQTHPSWLTSHSACWPCVLWVRRGSWWRPIICGWPLGDRHGHWEQVVAPVALAPPQVAPLPFPYPHGGGFQNGPLTSLPCIAPACHPALHPRVEISRGLWEAHRLDLAGEGHWGGQLHQGNVPTGPRWSWGARVHDDLLYSGEMGRQCDRQLSQVHLVIR